VKCIGKFEINYTKQKSLLTFVVNKLFYQNSPQNIFI